MMTIIGQGLAGTLVGLEAEKRGQSFRVVDERSGATASRAAAGLFNPLTGPRLSSPTGDWSLIAPHYRSIEVHLGIDILHLMTILRPIDGERVNLARFPLEADGWNAKLCPPNQSSASLWASIAGGGWVDIPLLLDLVRQRWLTQGILEDRRFDPREGQSSTVVWCGGVEDLAGPIWGPVPGISGRWQPVRGDVLTVEIPELTMDHIEIGAFFLIPLGQHRFRWGATHESDILDFGPRPEARVLLEASLATRLGGRAFKVLDHNWGVRPASRSGLPLLLVHPEHPRWTLFNGFGGRGVATIPGALDRLP